jgi:uncharacterized membrane protein YGL010W
MICFSIILLLTPVRVGSMMNAAEVVSAAAIVGALFIDVPAALVFLIGLSAAELASQAILRWEGVPRELALGATLFVFGWACQLVGHQVFEKNRPAFSRDLVHLLVGPLWIARKLLPST